jgi:hypothetical protein
MAISVTWGTKTINVPKDDLLLVQAAPTEIRQLDLNQFRLALKDLEDSEEGMPFLDTHRHVQPIDVGGVTLARVIEIINGYTVTFEDGQYAVNLVGANSNVGDVVNVNQVSVRSGNSAGLVTSAAIEFGEYQGRVTLDTGNETGLAQSGSVYPIGTLRQPSDNVPDALVIAEARGFTTVYFLGDLHLTAGQDGDDFIFLGTSHVQSTVTIDPGALVARSIFRECTVQGTLDGENEIDRCLIGDLAYFSGHVHNCGLTGTITLGGTESSVLADCMTVDPELPPHIDMGGSMRNLAMPNFSGLLTLRNMPDGFAGVGLAGGTVMLEPSVTGGTVQVSGVGSLVDTNGDRIDSGTWNGGVTIINQTVSTQSVVEEVYEVLNPGIQTAATESTAANVNAGEAAAQATVAATESGLSRKTATNKAVVSSDDLTVTIYDDDGITPLYVFGISSDKRIRTPV